MKLSGLLPLASEPVHLISGETAHAITVCTCYDKLAPFLAYAVGQGPVVQN